MSASETTETTRLLANADGVDSVDGAESVESPIESPRKDSWNGGADFVGLPWWQRPSVFWLIPPYVLYTLAFGGVLVPRLNLIIDLICRRYFADRDVLIAPVILGAQNPQCQVPVIQRSVATFTLVISVVSGLLSAITAPRLGALSDRHGRNRILIITSLGSLVGEVITIFAVRYPDVLHYNWLIAAAVFDGLSGSFTTSSVISHSYTSDCTPPSRRSVSFGYIHACLFAGMAAGPLLSGYIVRWTGSLLSVFYVSLGCHVVFVLYIALVLPESLSARRQQVAREKHALDRTARAIKAQEDDDNSEADQTLAMETARSYSPAWMRPRVLVAWARRSNPFAPLAVLAPAGAHNARARRNIILLAVVDTVLLSAAMSLGSVTLLYSEFMFHWGNFETSAFMSTVSSVRVVVLAIIFPVVNYVIRTRPAARHRRISGVTPVEANTGADDLDVWLIRSAILSDVLGVAGYAMARTPALFVLSGVVTAFGGLGSATVQSVLTKHVTADRVGELLGAIGLLHGLSRVFAPLVFNGLYAATVGSFPQAVFVLVASVFGGILVLSCFVRPHVYLSEPEEAAELLPPPAEAVFVEDDVMPPL